MTTMKAHQIIDDLAISEGLYSLIRHIEDASTRVSNTIKLWLARSKARHQLATMSDRLLVDIGLNRGDIAVEINKYFWQR